MPLEGICLSVYLYPTLPISPILPTGTVDSSLRSDYLLSLF